MPSEGRRAPAATDAPPGAGPDPIPLDPTPEDAPRGPPVRGVALAIASLTVLAYLLALATGEARAFALFAKDNAALARGEWWRLLTPLLLHSGAAHLAGNALALFIVGPLAEARLGSLRFLLVYLAAGAAGTLASFLLTPEGMVGASGAIFGVGGALLALALRGPAPVDRGTLLLVGLLLGPDLLMGFFAPATDPWAHVGGLAAGLALGAGLPPRAP